MAHVRGTTNAAQVPTLGFRSRGLESVFWGLPRLQYKHVPPNGFQHFGDDRIPMYDYLFPPSLSADSRTTSKEISELFSDAWRLKMPLRAS